MSILCKLGQHQAAPQVRANGGASFGRCRGCGCDLILAASGWRPVPSGYRVVWTSAPPVRAADPAQLDLALAEPAWPPPGSRRIARPVIPPPTARAPRTGRAILQPPARSTA
jgi:hypothetical protein